MTRAFCVRQLLDEIVTPRLMRRATPHYASPSTALRVAPLRPWPHNPASVMNGEFVASPGARAPRRSTALRVALTRGGRAPRVANSAPRVAGLCTTRGGLVGDDVEVVPAGVRPIGVVRLDRSVPFVRPEPLPCNMQRAATLRTSST